ncbi:YjgN family protein [uncultured Litoreibacter sp.]|uniref:YjgN family protein n=1 Tax=uncultured Litoreibacter sp. TaxID=1392394 RepID=UPI002639794A|nr:YjgN family protein [uncultured Litoreibacter sp.]
MSTNLPANAKPFEFTGNAKEWFGIWIVNLLLSIVTLGIYSAWAKVRTKKYFHNHTIVEGRNFDYHATGKQILIGRLIVIAAFIVFQVAAAMSPFLAIILVLGLLVAFPWLIVRSMIFNARMTSFSNVRFGFVGAVGQAFLVFIVYPLLTVLTLYTTLPILDRATKSFSINNHKLGQARFNMEVGLGPFYKAFLVAIAWIVVVGFCSVVVTGFSFANFAYAMENIEHNPEQGASIIALFYLIFFVAFLPAAFIYQALTRNAIYNNTTLDGGHKFASNVTAPKLLWIAVSSMVVVVCTLFLMLPWAQVRMARYMASHTGLIPGGSLDDFVTQQQEAGGAMGDAYTDLEAIDVGLPI